MWPVRCCLRPRSAKHPHGHLFDGEPQDVVARMAALQALPPQPPVPPRGDRGRVAAAREVVQRRPDGAPRHGAGALASHQYATGPGSLAGAIERQPACARPLGRLFWPFAARSGDSRADTAAAIAAGCCFSGLSLGLSGARAAYRPDLLAYFDELDPRAHDAPVETVVLTLIDRHGPPCRRCQCLRRAPCRCRCP